MLKQGYIELNEFIKKHYGIESSYTVRNKRDSIIKLIKRNDKEHLILKVNTVIVVEEQKLFDFLLERENYIEKHGGKLTWRLKKMKTIDGNNTSFWYCEHCTEEVCSENVTFQELHDRCGHPVRWVELEVQNDSKD